MSELAEPGGVVVARREAADWERFASSFSRIADNIRQVIQGKEQEVRLALVCLIGEGHLVVGLLIHEVVPGGVGVEVFHLPLVERGLLDPVRRAEAVTLDRPTRRRHYQRGGETRSCHAQDE